MTNERALRLKTIAAQWLVAVAVSLSLLLALARALGGLDVDTAASRAAILLKDAGGTDKVIEEADRLLDKFRPEHPDWLSAFDLQDFPALKNLGGRVAIREDSPTRVQILIPGHSQGYSINVYDKDATTKHKRRPDERELVDSRLFVTR